MLQIMQRRPVELRVLSDKIFEKGEVFMKDSAVLC